MNVLFVYYVPSGGMDTLNRLRCRALKNYGIQGHCLYYGWGSGMQNISDIPTFVTKNDIEIKHIIDNGNYNVIVVTTDYVSFPRFRMLGFTGKLVLEVQGYGPKEVAREELTRAIPYVNAHAAGLLNPHTPHIAALFSELYPHIPQFNFNNAFDTLSFTYQSLPKQQEPIIGWLGRIQDNKNWREFLNIGHALIHQGYPNLQLWMFEDHHLSVPEERVQFLELVEQLQLKQHLTLRSNVQHAQMPSYYSMIGDSGGFLCSTSKVEGAPYAVLEAMSCRCPVLTTHSDGVSSSICHNVTGKYYHQGDIAGAVEEAKELMGNQELRESIRSHAKFHLQHNFSADAYCRHFIAMLEKL
ncbi:glycosyltransferase family 4 protein [Paenibacillus alginolyticus]|uniref:Glycosyltransferase n=1 Tax=Paenibacillus alginolyticus TaxID=59839 RepID=A0ABT4GDU9_9BACL|nr:glycosyltransferase [Paenibacillus alginolyticus]MCY9694366.1 glycosyltransferase [Paenibacillus alginolyticus]MEC0147535.1 glycosyltransferase [Paenibacillus alginolyticus]